MRDLRLAIVFTLILMLLTCSASGVDGDWLTNRDKALATAERLQKPILAVAMDHG